MIKFIEKQIHKYRMRKPVVRNEYGLKPADLLRLKVVDPSKMDIPTAEYVDLIKGYVINGTAGLNEFNQPVNESYLVFYDDNAPSHAGETQFFLKSNGHVYVIDNFYRKKDVKCAADLQIQERLIKKLNKLIDAGALAYRK